MYRELGEVRTFRYYTSLVEHCFLDFHCRNFLPLWNTNLFIVVCSIHSMHFEWLIYISSWFTSSKKDPGFDMEMPSEVLAQILRSWLLRFYNILLYWTWLVLLLCMAMIIWQTLKIISINWLINLSCHHLLKLTIL